MNGYMRYSCGMCDRAFPNATALLAHARPTLLRQLAGGAYRVRNYVERAARWLDEAACRRAP